MRSMLVGGDRRSIGRSAEVTAFVLRRPKQFEELIACLWDADPIVAMRAADAAEKISRERPKLLQPFKSALLSLLAETHQKELRWHLAVMVPRLPLTALECNRAAEDLQRYLDDPSSIVKTFALQGLFDLAMQGAGLWPTVEELLHLHARSGTAAMRARARKLLALIEKSWQAR